MPIQILLFVVMVTLILGKGKSCDLELQQAYYLHWNLILSVALSLKNSIIVCQLCGLQNKY